MTPVLRYRNPGAAARWLCEAFGFHEAASAQDTDQHVKYIQLGLGDSCVLVRPVSSSVFDDLMVQPSAVGGGNTHVLYLTIADAEGHCAHAKSAGAKIELEPQDDGLGGRFYTCRDPEGHLWSFGTKSYDVLDRGAAVGTGARPPIAPGPGAASDPNPAGRGKRRRALAALTILLALAGSWLIYQTYGNGSFEAGTAMTTGAPDHGQADSDRLALEVDRRLAAETASSDAAARLAEEKTRRLAAEAASAEALAKLTEERNRRLAVETAAAEAQAKLGQESAGAAEVRQAQQRLEGDLDRQRREAQDALALAQQRLAAQTAEAARDKEDAAKSLTSLQQVLAEHKARSERAQAELEATLEAERAAAAREKTEQAAAAIAASAEAAAVREELSELEQAKAKQGDELEAAYAMLQTIRGEIESLRSSQGPPKGAPPGQAHTALAAVASEPPATAAAAAPSTRPSTPCAQAVQGKVRLAPNGSRAWPEGILARLCHAAETSLEPARCYDELMRGKVSWGTSSTWTTAHALLLCAGTHNARQTLDCFATSIAANDTWAAAIDSCRGRKP